MKPMKTSKAMNRKPPACVWASARPLPLMYVLVFWGLVVAGLTLTERLLKRHRSFSEECAHSFYLGGFCSCKLFDMDMEAKAKRAAKKEGPFLEAPTSGQKYKASFFNIRARDSSSLTVGKEGTFQVYGPGSSVTCEPNGPKGSFRGLCGCGGVVGKIGQN